MIKYAFERGRDEDVVVLPRKGTLGTPSLGHVEYQINDCDVRLDTGDYFFAREDIDQLIDFLKAVKNELKDQE